MELNYKKLGNGKPLLILHGLFGMLDNWQSIAIELSSYYTVYIIDLRNHGRSPHHSEHNYQVMMNDIFEFANQQHLLQFYLLGHSMGGKVAMKFAQNYPEFVEKLVVVDIAPKFYPFKQDAVIQALQAVDFTVIKNRKEVEVILRQYLLEEDTIQFLLKNIYWNTSEKLSWRFNLSVLASNLQDIGVEIADRVFYKPTLFIKGSLSNYILPSDVEDIKIIFPNSKITEVENAGHWVHAEKPKEFIILLTRFFS